MSEWRRDGYLISTDPTRIDVDAVHAFLVHESYWAEGRTRDQVERSIEHSIAFGVYEEASGRLVGFSRVITDRATFAWVCDVFVVPDARGRGLGLWLMEVVHAHPELQGLRRWLLATRDAHDLYRKVGYRELPQPGRFMIMYPAARTGA